MGGCKSKTSGGGQSKLDNLDQETYREMNREMNGVKEEEGNQNEASMERSVPAVQEENQPEPSSGPRKTQLSTIISGKESVIPSPQTSHQDNLDASSENATPKNTNAESIPADPPEANGSVSRKEGMKAVRILRKGDLIPSVNGSRSYEVQSTLGKGSYSRVYLAIDSESKVEMAVKAVHKKSLKPGELASMHRETSILASIKHPHVIKYVEHFEDQDMLYIVTEYLPGGELFERVVEREYYNEQDVRTVMKTLLQTIKYCHDRGIVHRDIKPENILLERKDDDALIKLADFGFAKKVEFDSYNSLQTACGTPGYVAPEILSHSNYDKRVDVWSLGVVAYILLCGYPPFRKSERKQLFKQIKAAAYEFDSPWWDPVSDQAKHFVSLMLKANPSERASIDDLLKHEFLSVVVDRDLKSVLGPLKEWNAKRKLSLFRNAWYAIKAFEKGSSRRIEASAMNKENEEAEEDRLSVFSEETLQDISPLSDFDEDPEANDTEPPAQTNPVTPVGETFKESFKGENGKTDLSPTNT